MGVWGVWGSPAQICLPAKVQETNGVEPQGPGLPGSRLVLWVLPVWSPRVGGSIIRKPWGLVSCSAVTVVRLLITS